MAAAYATIANDGVYIEPTFYTEIVDNTGNIVMKTNQETTRVFSKQVAYIVKELLTEPVTGENGTATYCSISGIDVAAKTGTTNENYDKWLCGFTSYYTAVTWFGYDQNETIYYNNQNPAGVIWANVMRRVHNGLASSSFEEPSWIVEKTICADSGLIANSGCTDTYTEYYLWGTEPESTCTTHSGKQVTTKDTSSSNENTSTNEIEIYIDDGEELELDINDEITNNIVQQEPINNTDVPTNITNNNDINTNTNINANTNSNTNTNASTNTNTNTNTNVANNTSTNATTNTNTSANTNTNKTQENSTAESSNRTTSDTTED